MSRTTQIVNILLIVAIIGSLIAGYFLFIRGGGDGTKEDLEGMPLVSDPSDSDVGGLGSTGVFDASAVASGELSLSSTEVILLLEKIRSIDLDDALFKSAAFQSLGNSTVELTPEVQGIKNPFGKL